MMSSPASTLPAARLCAALALAVFLASPNALRAQADPTPPPNPDAQIVQTSDAKPRSPAELQEAAWTMLTNAVTDPKHPDLRTQGLAAVALLGNSPRGLKLIEDAMVDHDIDIRSAAALSAGQTMAPAIATPLRQLLDDKEPPVAFAAAVSLWKMKDYSGEDILMTVANGERTTEQGRMSGAEHTVSRDLRHPGGIAKFAAMQGAGMLLGPFGYGITAYEYLRKNGGDVARVTALELLAENRTTPIRLTLMAALLDKDPGVRLAAAKSLNSYHQADVSAAIARVFDDSKPPVRFTAAASYLISAGAAPGIPKPGETPVRPTHTRR